MRTWPAGVDSPDALGWQPSATRWLQQIAPPGYAHPLLARRPLLLAHICWWSVRGLLEGARRGHAAAAADLQAWAGDADISHLRGCYARTGSDLKRLLGEVEAVRDALLRDAHRRAQDLARGRRPPPDGTKWRQATRAAATPAPESGTTE